jgi:hypothetical protein
MLGMLGLSLRLWQRKGFLALTTGVNDIKLLGFVINEVLDKLKSLCLTSLSRLGPTL